MEIQERISRQRVKHIVESYQLEGNNATEQEVSAFMTYLDDLFSSFPHPLIELSLTESLVKSWANVPMTKGVPFLTQAHTQLKKWKQQSLDEPFKGPIKSTLSPAQFSQITGLDPSLIFDEQGVVLPQTFSIQGAPESL